MNKKLLLTLFVVGVLVFGVAMFFFFKAKNSGGGDDEASLIDVPFSQRPVASLTPSEDGHWLKLNLDKIMIDGAGSLDYELLYSLPDGRTQGVPGTVALEGSKSIERDLLLGSESSGKFRYDEGVEEGTLTIRFRNNKGKLLAKFTTKWHLQNGSDELTSADSKFMYKLEKSSDAWFLTMETFGLPDDANVSEAASGPYGVFTSAESLPSGSAEGWMSVSSNFFYK